MKVLGPSQRRAALSVLKNLESSTKKIKRDEYLEEFKEEQKLCFDCSDNQWQA